MKRYEVESEINPRYLETNDMSDYYGLYHVVCFDDGKKETVKTFSGEYMNGRRDAYNYAGELQEQTMKKRNSNYSRIEVLFTPEQLALIKEQADKFGMSIGECVRDCVLTAHPSWRNVPDVPKRGKYKR